MALRQHVGQETTSQFGESPGCAPADRGRSLNLWPVSGGPALDAASQGRYPQTWCQFGPDCEPLVLSYLPTLSAFLEAAGVVIVFLAWCVVGAAAGGRSRYKCFDPLVGWALFCLPYVCLGTLTSVSFLAIDIVSLLILAAGWIVCCWRKIDIDLGGWLPYGSLALPFLCMVAPTGAYGWDQLSHWIPNIDYITAHQHFPGRGYPPSSSVHAGYPYGFALAAYWVTMLMRQIGAIGQTVGTAAAFNVLLLVAAARMLVEKFKDFRSAESQQENSTLGELLFAKDQWLAAALSLLCVTALSPTFLPTNSISATADNPTAVALLAIAMAALPRSNAHRTPTGNIVQLSLLLVLTAYLKEDNAIPALALLAGRVVLDARAGNQPLRTLRVLALAAIPMFAVAALWHGYVWLQIPQGEMTLRSPAEWRPDLLPRVLAGMAALLIQKIGFLVLLLPVLFHGARALLRKTGARDGADALAVIAASGFIGYTLFLAVAYVSIFSPTEAERQAAFWRYETHLGLVLEASVLLLLFRISVHKRRGYAWLAPAAVAVMLLAPVVMAPVIRPDLDPQTVAIRNVAQAVDSRILGARTLAVADQYGNGAPCPMFVYLAKSPLTTAECVTKITRCTECEIRKAVSTETFIWANGWSPELGRATGLQVSANGSYLLQHAADGWHVIGQWPRTPTKMRGVRAIWQAS